MKHSQKNTAFYIEILALLFMLIFGMTVVIQIFGYAKRMSLDAKELAGAVPAAQNVVEVFLAEETGSPAEYYYDRNWNSCDVQESTYTISLEFTDQEQNTGTLRNITATVTRQNHTIYQLVTKKYLSGN